MNAIIRHLGSGEHFLAAFDDDGEVTSLSAALPLTAVFGRDVDAAELTPDQWEEFADADLEPFDDDHDVRYEWTAERVAVVHAFDDENE